MKNRAFVIAFLFLLAACSDSPQTNQVLSYGASGNSVVFECHQCSELDNHNCDLCNPASNVKQYLNGLVVKYNNKPADVLRSPFDVTVRGSRITIQDRKDKSVTISIHQTPYATITEALTAIFDCSCGSGGGGSADGVVNGGTVNGSGVLTLTRTIGGNVTISGFASGSGDTVTNLDYSSNTLTVTTDQGSFNVDIDPTSMLTENAYTIGGTLYPAGTPLNVILNSLNSAVNTIDVTNITASSFDFVDAAGNVTTVNFPSGSGNTSILTDNPASNSFDHDDGTGNVTTVNYGTANSVSLGSGAPVTNGVEINDTYVDTSITNQPVSYVWNGTWIQQSSASSSALSYYDSGLGFWVYATAGVITTSPVLGNYDIDVPSGGTILSFHKDFSSPGTELTGLGEAVIVVDHNTASFNTSSVNALYPMITFVSSALGDQQFPPQSTGFTQPHGVSLFYTSVTGGATTQTLTNVNGVIGSGNTLSVKGKF